MDALLEKLRTLSTLATAPLLEKPYPFSLLAGGFPKSSLIELSGPLGSGKTEAVLKFISENPQLEIGWIEQDFTIYPNAFLEFQIELKRILFIQIQNQSAIQIVSQILKSQVFQVLILSHLDFDEVDFRRLQLLSKQSGVLIIFLSTHPVLEKSWSFFLQIQVKRSQTSKRPILKTIRSRNSSIWPIQRE